MNILRKSLPANILALLFWLRILLASQQNRVVQAFSAHYLPAALRNNNRFLSRSRRRYIGCGGSSPTVQCFASHPDRSCIELTDPITGCEVVLVGCFHGSPSSAADVKREILAKPTDAIALELCASRFADLRKMTMSTAPPEPLGPSRLLRFLHLVRVTIQKRGLSTGIATGIIGSFSGLQTALSGFTPGLEFTTALELSQQQQQQLQQSDQSTCDLVLADQVVHETLEKVGKLPSIVQSMMSEITSGTAPSIDETQWGQAAKALSNALSGDPSLKPDYQVVIPQVITRNSAVVQELLRLMVPPVVATQLTLTLVNQVLFPSLIMDGSNDPSLYYAATDTAATSAEASLAVASVLTTSLTTVDATTMDSSSSLDNSVLLGWLLDMLPHAALLVFFLTTAYALLAVPITQVILAERDDQLTRGIQAACLLAAEKKHCGGEDKNKGRVVAVLGLLHVNGVAQRMLAASTSVADQDLLSERI